MVKVFADSGLTALTNHMKTTKRTADESSSAVSQLESDFQAFVMQYTDALMEIDSCLETIEQRKADIALFGVYDAEVEWGEDEEGP
jgi:hypothetical protein